MQYNKLRPHYVRPRTLSKTAYEQVRFINWEVQLQAYFTTLNRIEWSVILHDKLACVWPLRTFSADNKLYTLSHPVSA